jgi:hypothetical protein
MGGVENRDNPREWPRRNSLNEIQVTVVQNLTIKDSGILWTKDTIYIPISW